MKLLPELKMHFLLQHCLGETVSAMSSSKKTDKWLLVQWGSGSRNIINLKSVITPSSEAKVGTVVVADTGNGTHEAATILASSRDRKLLENQIYPPTGATKEEVAERSTPEEAGDFSASASSWAPSDDNVSSEDEAHEKVEKKKIKIECFTQRSYSNRRTSKILKPSHRANAINTMIAKNRKRTIDNAKTNDQTGTDKVSLPDSTRKNDSPAPKKHKSDVVVAINLRDILDMKQCFLDLFKLLKDIKSRYTCRPSVSNHTETNQEEQGVKCETNNTTIVNNTEYESDASVRSRSEDLNRSDDNVLITNKYDNVDNANNNTHFLVEQNTNQNQNTAEWIPIGSGATLVHKDQYRKVNWKSYTIATRTLLLAVFPRRVLATHSLTGKRSPAFQDKPAKMCLDPKLVNDVIIEITERFHVKENLVRTIITTKCADECKMYKTRIKRKTLPAKNKNNDTTVADNNDDANQTC